MEGTVIGVARYSADNHQDGKIFVADTTPKALAGSVDDDGKTIPRNGNRHQ